MKKIGYLFGVPANPLAGLQLIDSYGQYSNYYRFPVVETTPATTVATTNPVTTTPTTTKPSTTKSTTKPSTTKSTTKPSTTKSIAKPSTAKSTTEPVTTKRATPIMDTTVAQRTTQADKNTTVAKTSGSVVIGTSTAAAVEDTLSEEVMPDVAAGAQGDSDIQTKVSEYEIFTEPGVNDSGGSGIKKQIAAVVAAIILLSLAVYFLIIASKGKSQSKPEPEKPPEDTDGIDLDDDF